jgi:hypothetical protein
MTRPTSQSQRLSDLSAMPGAEHSFLKQLATPPAAAIRAHLSAQQDAAPPAVANRWADALNSFDNRRFFQALAEVQGVHHLSTTGWRLRGIQGRTLAMEHPDGREVELLTLAFLRQVRPAPDRAAIRRLVRTLGRLGARSRIVVLVRRWLPHDFDPEPVRQAVDLWLDQVDKGDWQGRHAAFEDEHLSLEFSLTGRKSPDGRGAVAFALGPFMAQHTAEVLETRLVLELDQLRLARPAGQAPPLLLSCVANQPWSISSSYLRGLFLGKPDCTWTDEDGLQRSRFSRRPGPSLFQDPIYHHASGVMMVALDPADPRQLAAETHLHPWAEASLAPGDVGGSTWAAEHRTDDEATVRNYPR